MNRQWMPLYIADYLRETGHLSTLEHGAYMLLIMHYWTTGSLPDSEPQLARIARVTTREWKAMRDTLRALFLDGWKHKRVEKELAEAQARHDRRSRAGQTAAESRWRTASESDADRIPIACDEDAIDPHNAGARDRAQQSQSQSQPSSKVQTDSRPPSPEALAGGRAGLPSDLVKKMLEVVGDEPCRKDQNFEPIQALMTIEGCDEDDVLDGIAAALSEPRKDRIGTWGFFVGWIRTAKRDRLAGPRKISGSSPRPSPADGPRVVLKAGLPAVPISAIRDALTRGAWFPKTWGPPIGQPGCLVPSKLAAELMAATVSRQEVA